jgi:type I restriction enzyme, S subunit
MITTANGAWKQGRLGDFFRIKHGYAFKGEFFASSGPYIVLTPGNFQADGGLKLKGEKEKFYTGEFPPEFLLERDDFLVVMTDLTQNAPILGSPAFVPQGGTYLHNQRLGKVVDLDTAAMDRRFLYYLFNSRGVRDQIKATATGATVRHTAPDRIYAVRVAAPPLPVQRKIARVLSAYDDLIENNTRRIAILEEMVWALYREWFVKFRFPGHDGIRMADSSLGAIPQGWTVKTLLETSSYIGRGVSPKYDDASRSLVINQRCIRDERLNLDPARRHSTKVPTDKLLRFGDVLINSGGVGTLGRVAQVYFQPQDTTADALVSIVRPLECMSADYFALAIMMLRPHFESLAQGSTGQTQLARDRIAETRIVVPPSEIQGLFTEMVRPMRQVTLTLAQENANLRRTRDLLLPKLIVSEVDVTGFDTTHLASSEA